MMILEVEEGDSQETKREEGYLLEVAFEETTVLKESELEEEREDSMVAILELSQENKTLKEPLKAIFENKDYKCYLKRTSFYMTKNIL